MNNVYKPIEWPFKHFSHWCILLPLSLSCITENIFAQNIGKSQPAIPITGQVTSAEDGIGLPGVTVVVKAASIGTVTDMNGFYTIEVPSEESVLVFSFLGLLSEERTVGDQAEINVVMREDLKQLDEVVVVGYGTQERKDLTGAISSISAGDITRIPVTTLDQSLQGRMAGVQVTQADAAPGGGVTIKVRGGSSLSAGNEPLYVVDGYPILSNSIEFLNPNDIESIEVLKD